MKTRFVVRLVLASFCLLASQTFNQSQAALVLVNGGFEDGTQTSLYSNTAAAMGGWTGYGNHANAFGIWSNHAGAYSGIAGFPTMTGVRAASLITNTDGQVAVFFRSLGTIDAADVGKEFSLSADLGARSFANHAYNATMSVSLRSGTAANNLGTLLGSAGVLDVATVQSANTPFGLFTRTAAFTPAASDIGTEVFAVLDVVGLTTFLTDQNQHVADNVTLVPEPSAIVLAGTAMLLGIVVSRRRK